MSVTVVGGGVFTVNVTVRESVPAFPTASRAVTVITLSPVSSGIPERLQLVVPVATPLAPRSLAHRTCETETLSAAMPPRLSEVADVA